MSNNKLQQKKLLQKDCSKSDRFFVLPSLLRIRADWVDTGLSAGSSMGRVIAKEQSLSCSELCTDVRSSAVRKNRTAVSSKLKSAATANNKADTDPVRPDSCAKVLRIAPELLSTERAAFSRKMASISCVSLMSPNAAGRASEKTHSNCAGPLLRNLHKVSETNRATTKFPSE